MALNYPISADTKSDMLAVVLPDGWVYLLMGSTTRGDQPPVFYQFSSTSTATDDGNNVMTPTALIGSPGRYIKTKLSYNDLVNLISFATVATSGNYNDLINKPTQSFNSAPSRLISTTGSNNTFTVNTTRSAHVTYTVNFSATLTLGTSNGRVTLDYSTDSGATWTTISSVSQVFGLSITITTNQDMVLTGIVPANSLVRINRASNTTVTITMGSQQEVLL